MIIIVKAVVKMFKLAIFDLDGTLVDSILDLADAVNVSLTEMGYPVHNIDSYRYFVGEGVIKLCERALPENARNDVKIKELYNKFSDYYGKHYLNKTKPYDGINGVVDYLRSHNVKTAVASNKPHEFTVKIVNSLFKKGSFDLIKGNIDISKRKPSPYILEVIMGELRITKDETVMIGDSGTDILTAKNAGIESIGCLWGFRTRNELEAAGAGFIAEKPDEIIKFIMEGK